MKIKVVPLICILFTLSLIICLPDVALGENEPLASDYDIETFLKEIRGDGFNYSSENISDLAKRDATFSQAVTQLLNDENNRIKIRALLVIKYFRISEALPAILKKIEAIDDSDFQYEAMDTLARLDPPQDTLISLVSRNILHVEAKVRESALRGLYVYIFENKSIPLSNKCIKNIIKCLKDENNAVKRAASLLIGFISIIQNDLREEAIQNLFDLLLDTDYSVVEEAIKTLQRLNVDFSKGQENLLRLAKNEQLDQGRPFFRGRIEAVNCLGKINSPSDELIAALYNLILNDSSRGVVQEAALSLASYKNVGEIKMLLLEKLKNATQKTKINIFIALRVLDISDPEVANKFIDIILSNDSDSELQLEAADALMFVPRKYWIISDIKKENLSNKISTLLNKPLEREKRIILLHILESLLDENTENVNEIFENSSKIIDHIAKAMYSRLNQFGVASWFYYKGPIDVELASIAIGILFYLSAQKLEVFSKEQLENLISSFLQKIEIALHLNLKDDYDLWALAYALQALDLIQKRDVFPDREKISDLKGKVRDQLIFMLKNPVNVHTHAVSTAVIALIKANTGLNQEIKELLFDKLNKGFHPSFPTQVGYKLTGYRTYGSWNGGVPFDDSRGSVHRAVLLHLARWLLKPNTETQSHLIASIHNYTHYLLVIEEETRRAGSHGYFSGISPKHDYPTLPYIASVIKHFSLREETVSEVSFSLNRLWKSISKRISNNIFLSISDLENDKMATTVAFANFTGGLAILALSGQFDWLSLQNKEEK